MMEKIQTQQNHKKRVLLLGIAIILVVSAGIVTWMRASGFWDSSALDA